jgi:hypothetical protein
VGRLLILLGIGLIVAGAVVEVTGRIPGGPRRLPGDIVIRGKNSVFYFPIVTSLLLSALLTLVIWLVNRLR